MSIRLTDKYVREKILREHTYQWSRSRDKGNIILKERDDRHRELNEEFGFMDRDGTFGVGCKSHTNLKYKNVYTWIDDKATKEFQKINSEFNEWEKKQKLSIYEYAFLIDCKNVSHKYLDEEFSKIKIVNGLIFDSIKIHAKYLINLKGGTSKAEIFDGKYFNPTLLESLNEYFKYVKRFQIDSCESFLKIKMWHFKEKSIIRDYFAELKSRVYQELDFIKLKG